MRALAWIMWTVALVWLALSISGALNFQELYGQTSGIQVVGIALLVGSLPALIGWWAYRRASAQEARTTPVKREDIE